VGLSCAAQSFFRAKRFVNDISDTDRARKWRIMAPRSRHFEIFGAEDPMSVISVTSVRAICLALLIALFAIATQGQTTGSEADSAAIKKVCGDFSESFTRHDAHSVAMTFAEDADFANMRGAHSHGRKDIENWFASLFRGNLKDSVRTDTVRSIRFFSPDLAEAEAETVITGTKAADGSETPPRKGLMIVLMIRQNGRWLIGSFHEAEYPASRAGAANGATGAPAN
jgi:uncharacterized protein (TIGR02246 family)